MDKLEKNYDTLVFNRLLLWYNVDKYPTGAQKGRSFLEQIMLLRMLCDYVLLYYWHPPERCVKRNLNCSQVW